MKRSEINDAIIRAEADFAKVGFALPGFAKWSLEDWKAQRAPARDMIETGLGWDVTDFAEGRFGTKGLLLFTVRNGKIAGGFGNRPYAEKIMIARRDQVTPMHRHGTKVEDIINRAALTDGATLAIRLYTAAPDGSLSKSLPVVAHLDGMVRELAPGSVVKLNPGESITLFPTTYHSFWGEGGDVVAGEVSSVNDDRTDNIFAEPLARFSPIEEDAAVFRPIVTDIAGLSA
ncbi:D-lyxose/D-mannose family sugar isomerase [Oryzibacter oryziterrae]|uniref:D-lyxose/D-mannose family sugar isomerase n=1 Tax=Oryzibacter oryziterrae TaxID=2766474 RepID=UPI001F489D8F|nr:D-lyxose/D-mannose family sugar isomerase [Oryzibacter oryziterrae]